MSCVRFARAFVTANGLEEAKRLEAVRWSGCPLQSVVAQGRAVARLARVVHADVDPGGQHGDVAPVAMLGATWTTLPSVPAACSLPLDEYSLEQLEAHEWLWRSPRSKGRTHVYWRVRTPSCRSTRSISEAESRAIESRSVAPTGTMIMPSGPTRFTNTGPPRTPPTSASVTWGA